MVTVTIKEKTTNYTNVSLHNFINGREYADRHQNLYLQNNCPIHSINISSNVKDATYAIGHKFYLRNKYHRTNNTIVFLEDYLDEQVLPRSAPSAPLSDEHPFTDAVRAYIEDGIMSLSR